MPTCERSARLYTHRPTLMPTCPIAPPRFLQIARSGSSTACKRPGRSLHNDPRDLDGTLIATG